VYVGQMGRTIYTWCKEHMRHLCLNQSENQWWQNRFKTEPIINFSHTAVLNKVPAFVACLIKEAVEIRLHPTNLSRDGAFNLSWSW
jgi:hypothetical protein